ncbi:MAG: YIP1 family protein [Candidatus Binataceae bacterium]
MNSFMELPFFTIWYEPRATIRRLVDANPRTGVIALVVIASVAGVAGNWTVGNPVVFSIGAHPIHLFQNRSWRIFSLILMAAGPLLAIIMLYISGALLRWAGGLLGGTARSIEVRAALAWSMIPGLIGGVLYLACGLLGLVHAPQLPEPSVKHHFEMLAVWRQTLTPFSLIGLVLGLWGIVVLLKCIGEVHHFSAWRGLATLIIGDLTIMAGLMLIALLAPLVIVGAHIHPRTAVTMSSVAEQVVTNRPLRRITSPFTADQSQILDDLKAKRFAKLNSELSSYAEQAQREPLWEDNAVFAFQTFARSNANLAPLLDAWVKKFPGSYVAHVARAEYLSAAGWQARGSKWTSETTVAQFARMNEYLVQSDGEIGAALDLNRKFFLPHMLLLKEVKSSGDQTDCWRIASAALAANSASESIRASYMTCLEPRWGGSYEAMEKFARESQAMLPRNPEILLLLGLADFDRGRDLANRGNDAAAVSMFTQAIAESGDSARYYTERARALNSLRHYDEALADSERADQLWPNQPETVRQIAYALACLRHNGEALAKLDEADRLAPPEAWTQELRTWIERNSQSYAGPFGAN